MKTKLLKMFRREAKKRWAWAHWHVSGMTMHKKDFNFKTGQLEEDWNSYDNYMTELDDFTKFCHDLWRLESWHSQMLYRHWKHLKCASLVHIEVDINGKLLHEVLEAIVEKQKVEYK